MAQVTVKINGYSYTVGCEDGQEDHLMAMADQVESRIDSIKALGGQSGESRLLVLASLLLWSALGYFAGRRSAPILIGGAYWHFVDAVWLAVFFTFYVTPHLRG